MSEETKTYVFNPDSTNNVPAWMAMNNGSLFGNGNGWGGGVIGFILGLLFGNGGWFNGWGGNGGLNGGTGYLANQLNNDAGRELIIQAINGNRDAISSLATTLNSDINTISSAINTVNSSINTVGAQVGMSSLQVINAIQAGNSTLASQLAQCCCENRLLTTTQGYESQIRTLEQTNLLGSQADRNSNNIINAINAQTIAMNDGFCAIKERELQQQIDAKNDIINQLRAQANDQLIVNQIAAIVNPLQAQVNAIASRQPSTVSVVWPNLTVTENTATTTTNG